VGQISIKSFREFKNDSFENIRFSKHPHRIPRKIDRASRLGSISKFDKTGVHFLLQNKCLGLELLRTALLGRPPPGTYD
jgi:hypothetical protein